MDVLQYTEEGTCRFPQRLFLTGERSDVAVVGSGNKAMGKSSLLTFSSWDNLKLQDLGLYDNI